MALARVGLAEVETRGGRLPRETAVVMVVRAGGDSEP
jgi:hypothetical protein